MRPIDLGDTFQRLTVLANTLQPQSANYTLIRQLADTTWICFHYKMNTHHTSDPSQPWKATWVALYAGPSEPYRPVNFLISYSLSHINIIYMTTLDLCGRRPWLLAIILTIGDFSLSQAWSAPAHWGDIPYIPWIQTTSNYRTKHITHRTSASDPIIYEKSISEPNRNHYRTSADTQTHSSCEHDREVSTQAHNWPHCPSGFEISYILCPRDDLGLPYPMTHFPEIDQLYLLNSSQV